MPDWIKTIDRRCTDTEREEGVWIWEGNFPCMAQTPDEQPRRLPNLADLAQNNGQGGSWWSGAYASHWLPVKTSPQRPEPLGRHPRF